MPQTEKKRLRLTQYYYRHTFSYNMITYEPGVFDKHHLKALHHLHLFNAPCLNLQAMKFSVNFQLNH